jgi:hypothetical protein
VSYLDHRPNMTYTRDLAAVFRRGSVLMGPHLKGRWGDQAMMGRAFTRLGVPILGAIEPGGFLEGGGVTLIGDDTAVASLCDRANQEGTRALRELVLGKDVKYFLEPPALRPHPHRRRLMVLDDGRLDPRGHFQVSRRLEWPTDGAATRLLPEFLTRAASPAFPSPRRSGSAAT